MVYKLRGTRNPIPSQAYRKGGNCMQKRLKNFPMYLIDDDGNVFSEYTKKYLKTHLNNRGYVVCQLRDKNGKNCVALVHRLVAKTFIPNKLVEQLEVNHKDGNKLNSNVNNLEWCTRKENIHHGIQNGLISQLMTKQSILQYDLKNHFIKKWKSTTEIEAVLGYNHSNIVNCCKNRYKQAYGYIWRYEGVEANRDECSDVK